MYSFSMWFVEDESGEMSLWRTKAVVDSLGVELNCYRGRANGPNEGCFRWSSGVRGLVLLVLGSLGERGFVLEGGRGSAASSLDYAISKETNWLLDMFGVAYSGSPVIKRLVTRYNPERKRPGPVRLKLTDGILSRESVEVFVNGARCESPAELRRLYLRLKPKSRAKSGFESGRIGDEAREKADPRFISNAFLAGFLEGPYLFRRSESSSSDSFSSLSVLANGEVLCS